MIVGRPAPHLKERWCRANALHTKKGQWPFNEKRAWMAFQKKKGNKKEGLSAIKRKRKGKSVWIQNRIQILF
jgi:hypothetical protein